MVEQVELLEVVCKVRAFLKVQSKLFMAGLNFMRLLGNKGW